jgi:hypothetical protein
MRENSILGKLYLHNRNGVWWQSELELSPGQPIRFDIQVEGLEEGIDADSVFEGASNFVNWARQNELELRKRVGEKLLRGEYLCRAQVLLALSRPREAFTLKSLVPKLKLVFLQYFPEAGSSDWRFECSALGDNCEVLCMLNEDHEFSAPINVN